MHICWIDGTRRKLSPIPFTVNGDPAAILLFRHISSLCALGGLQAFAYALLTTLGPSSWKYRRSSHDLSTFESSPVVSRFDINSYVLALCRESPWGLASSWPLVRHLLRTIEEELTATQPLRSDLAPSWGLVTRKPYVVQVDYRQDTKVTGIWEQRLMVLNAQNNHALLSQQSTIAAAWYDGHLEPKMCW